VIRLPKPSFGCCVVGGEIANSEASGVVLVPLTDGGGEVKVVRVTPEALPTTFEPEARRSLEVGGEIIFLPPLEPGYNHQNTRVE
jgi:hypothetical protein